MNKKTILLAEDEMLIATLEKEQLENMGYAVHHVLTGEDAVTLALETDSQPDVILMDIDLGAGIDGTQAADQILQQRDVPIVFLSAHTEPNVVSKTKNIISYGYVVKDSGITVLDASIKIAMKLFDAKEQRRLAEAALRDSDERQAFLLGLSNTLRPVADPVDIQEIADRTLEYYKSDRCYYCEIVGDEAVIRRDASRGDLPSVVGRYPMSAFPIFSAVIQAGRPLVVRDTRTTHQLDEPLRELCAQLEISSFIDVPVVKKGKPVGILCITHCTPRDWTDNEVELSKEIAERMWATVERVRVEEEIKIQLVEKETLLKEVHHRVKNNIANIEGFLFLQANSVDIPEARDALKEAIHRVQSMRILYDKLLLADKYTDVSVRNYLENLIDSILEATMLEKNIIVERVIDDFQVATKTAVAVGIIVNELLTNVFKYAFHDREAGTVSIRFEKSERTITLEIQDDGVGIDDKIEENQSSGFGISIVNMLVVQLHGTFQMKNDHGTKSNPLCDLK